MNILIAVETLLTGGAEIFALRLAQGLAKENKVFLYRFYHDRIDSEMAANLAPDVTMLSFHQPQADYLRKFDSAMFKLGIDFSVTNQLIQKDLEQVVKQNQIDVIQSNQFKIDFVAAKVANKFNIPVVVTIHGDYLKFWHQPKKPVLHYENKLHEIMHRINAVSCISDVQLAFFQNVIQPVSPKPLNLVKIYNGYSLSPEVTGQNLKAVAGIPENNFVFGMVSRGIPDKGWEFAAEAFIKLNNPTTSLVFVGDSPYMQELKAKYSAVKNIYFAGYSTNPTEWIRKFDVGLLPSVYGSESLPTVVIEYLFCGKPVIASDVGEIKNMLKLEGGQTAGVVLPVKNNRVSETDLASAMQTYLQNQLMYKAHGNNAYIAARKFEIETCVKRYTETYRSFLKK